ncbi:hypothetical protein GTR02_03090 [Kineococcus sp. R8]|nr:hypothetical protein [Kineococcus siccus]
MYFGEAGAEVEAEKYPELFKNSFYDLAGVVAKVNDGDAFLLIGPKGAGKSSYIEYVQLMSTDSVGQFVTKKDLGELRGALQSDSTLSRAGSEITELAWSTWLWIQLFDSVMKDQSSSCHRDPSIAGLHRELRSAGLLSGDFRSVVQAVRKKQHKFSAPKFYEYTSESSGETRVNISQLRDILEVVVTQAETSNQHMLALDGLDSAIIGSTSYWQQLAALLRACTVVHRKVRSAQSHIRVVMLCRSDVLLKIPLPDSNKIRQGWGLEFDWSYGLDTPEDSHLWDLVEKKASARGRPIANLIDTYFPQDMEVGGRTHLRRIPMPRYLMELTRGTPRDMIMLLKKIQQQAPNVTELSVRHVRAGVNAYCKDYFAGEVANELVGLVPDAIASGAVGALSRLPSRRFTRGEFLDVFRDLLTANEVSADELLQQLYLAGAVANVIPGQREDYVRFYHRRSHADVSLQGPFLLHTALTISLNLPFGARL